MAVTANIHEAKTTLSKLIERALAGEEVIIAKAGKPTVRLVPVEKPVAVDRGAIFGKYEGQMILSDDWEDSPFDAEMERKWFGDEETAPAHAAEDGKPFKR
ncbi:type II toxin-antitoxin system Phd/YefM family antitoxin [Brevundimonas goettingensis]|uniref:Antitoxin n=1 Tax=Brevundimonas goettingensis TaxID=2774190 RepID=A0A975C144_9CAUL|nr:type II toxin-antitoxin system prevent-host-death family antitoxin [Brevundimonas goettingensis]QTC91876.1 type II toxin-antitoxin system prevent-host-death family antitoxin [Brevundimonas goettingensis]